MSEPTLWEWIDVTKAAMVAGTVSIIEWKRTLGNFKELHGLTTIDTVRGYDSTKLLLEADREGMLQKAYEDHKR